MTTINKKDALKRLDAIESEAVELRKLISNQRSGNVMEDVKTFKDALEIYLESRQLDDNIKSILDYSGDDPDMIAQQGFAQINIIREVLNEGWKPNWKNSSEYKYYPWFNMSSGVGLSYDGYGDTCAGTTVGSRLCFKSSELAKYAGNQFIEIYQKFYLL